MCFNATTTNIRTAKKDIICFKTMDGVEFKSKDGTLRYSEKRFKSRYEGFRYTAGYHYFNNNFPRKVKRHEALTNEGFHSYITLNHIHKLVGSAGRTSVIECCIPVGAKYLVSRIFGEYISSGLVIVGRVTPERFEELKKKYLK